MIKAMTARTPEEIAEAITEAWCKDMAIDLVKRLTLRTQIHIAIAAERAEVNRDREIIQEQRDTIHSQNHRICKLEAVVERLEKQHATDVNSLKHVTSELGDSIEYQGRLRARVKILEDVAKAAWSARNNYPWADELADALSNLDAAEKEQGDG